MLLLTSNTPPLPPCSDSLVVDSEWSLLKHLLRWMCHDPSTALLASDPAAIVTGSGDSGCLDGLMLPQSAVVVRGKQLLQKIRWPLVENEKLAEYVWRSKVPANTWDSEEMSRLVVEAIILQLASGRPCATVNATGDNPEIHWDAAVLERCNYLKPYHVRHRCRPKNKAGSI